MQSRFDPVRASALLFSPIQPTLPSPSTTSVPPLLIVPHPYLPSGPIPHPHPNPTLPAPGLVGAAVCPGNCNGRGTCLDPNVCQCLDGFSGLQCASTDNMGSDDTDDDTTTNYLLVVVMVRHGGMVRSVMAQQYG